MTVHQRFLSSLSSAASSNGGGTKLRLRRRLLDAARGILKDHAEEKTTTTTAATTTTTSSKRASPPLPCFALKAHHVQDNLIATAPNEFHARLCHLIRNAKKRVSLASLYIGPAANPVDHAQELELLQALSEIPSEVNVQIVMDSNRGVRKVPMPLQDDENGKPIMTSAAEAVSKAIHLQSNHQLYLCQVLPNPYDQFLPNPLNEVAGVFHIKAYVIDDTVLLSGANLSEEYFIDRHDRYLQITHGGNGLVDFYAQLIDILCHDASDLYQMDSQEQHDGDETTSSKFIQRNQTRRPLQPFWDHINELFADHSSPPVQEWLEDPNTMAVCVPTFHHPQLIPPNDTNNPDNNNSNNMPSDVDIILNILNEATSTTKDDDEQNATRVQLSSAYLNPSSELLDTLQRYEKVDLLTAGRMSHGFRPKKKAGNKGKAWIPTVFDHLQYQALKGIQGDTTTTTSTSLWHWQRPDWTFHAKGLWISQQTKSQTQQDSEELLAAVVGSSNYGRRSFERDMESNLILIFPPYNSKSSTSSSSSSSSLAETFQNEWKMLLQDSQLIENPQHVLVDEAPPLPWHVRICFPFIKSFF